MSPRTQAEEVIAHPGGPAVPRWAGAVDILSVVLILLTASVAVFGGFRLNVGPERLSVTSVWRVLAWTVAVVALRHGFVKHPTLLARVVGWLGTARRARVSQAVLPPFLASRAAVLAVGYLAVLLIGYPEPPPFRISRSELGNLPARWDAGWYLGVATDGYQWSPDVTAQQNIVFFPAYPLLMRSTGVILGARPRPGDTLGAVQVRYLFAGMAVSLATFLWGLVYVFRLARQDLDDERATVAVLLMASYPFAVFFAAPYTEGLFLVSMAGAIYHFRREEWARSGVWGLIAGLTRPNGALLSIPLGMMALARMMPSAGRWAAAARRLGWETARPERTRWSLGAVGWLIAALPGIGMLLYSAYLYTLTGNPFLWTEVQNAWGREYRGLDDLLATQFRLLRLHGLVDYMARVPQDAMNVVAGLFGLLMIVPIMLWFGMAYGVLVLVNLLPPLLYGGWLSIGRFTSVLFPLFIGLALIVPSRSRTTVAAVFAVLQAIAAMMFFTWRPIF